MSEEAVDLERATPSFFAEKTWRQALLLILLSLSLNLVGNGKVGLWDRDEPRYAGAVREMKQTGEWIVPQFNGEPRYHKPVLIYWLMAMGTSIGGDNPMGARLVSSIAGAATCVVVWLLSRRLLGSAWGFLAALMYAVAPIVVAEAKLATTDATLAFFLISAQVCLWELAKRDSARLAALFWGCMGLAVLVKGPIGPVLIAAAGVGSWWFRGPVEAWKRLRWKWGLLGFAGLVMPWYLAVGIKTDWDFYRFAVGNQLVQRVTTKMEDHGGFPGYYLVMTLLLFQPWSALVPPAMAAAWAKRKERPDLGFLLGWAIGPLVVLELVQTKLIHYYLPALPALAILSAWFLEQVATSELLTIRRWRYGRLSTSLLGGVGISAAIGALASLAILPAPMRLSVGFTALLMLLGTLFAVLRLHRGETASAARGLVSTWALIMALVGGWILPVAEPYRLSRVVGERLATLADRHAAKPVVVTYQEPGIIYALGRPAPTMRNWNLADLWLQDTNALIAPMFPNQIESMQKDGRFSIEIVDEVRGFNLNKGQPHRLSFARITKLPDRVAAGESGQKPLIK